MAGEAKLHDLSPPLLRQRRNLIAISFIVLFVHLAGAELGTATFLGVQITFKKPEVIIWFLWAFLLYFLYRYYLYLRQEPDLGIRTAFYDKLRALTFQKLHQLKNEAFPGVSEYGGEFDFRNMKKDSFWKRKVYAVARRGSVGDLENDEFSIDIRTFFFEGIRAALHVLLHRSYITDYFLPFMLAFAALLSGLVDVV